MQVEDWTPTRIGEIAWEVSNKSKGGEEVLSCTKHHGFVPSLEYFDKQVFSKNTDTYKLVKRGQFAYATIHLDEGSVDCLTIRDEGIISPMYTVFDVDETRVDRGFLLELLQTPMMLDRYAAIGQGSVNRRKSISFDTLAMETIQLPPLPEQKKIAAILASVDQSIRATEAVIEQTRRVKEGLLQDLLTRGIGHTRFKQTEIGEIPESWEVQRVDALCRVTSGATPYRAETAYFDGGTIPWVKTLDLHGGVVHVTDEMITDLALKETSCKMLPKGTVMCAMYGGYRQIGRSGILGMEGTTNQAISAMLIRHPDELLSAFLNYYLVGQRWRWKAIAASSRKDPNITRQDICGFRVAVPPVTEQRSIVERVDSASSAVKTARQTLRRHKQVKAGLLQDLLTGAVRVSA